MLPEFLGAFRLTLERYKLDCIKILANPHRGNNVLPLTLSKLLGTPFLPVGTPYPLDEQGKPMILLAQINFAEVPTLESYPTQGIQPSIKFHLVATVLNPGTLLCSMPGAFCRN